MNDRTMQVGPHQLFPLRTSSGWVPEQSQDWMEPIDWDSFPKQKPEMLMPVLPVTDFTVAAATMTLLVVVAACTHSAQTFPQFPAPSSAFFWLGAACVLSALASLGNISCGATLLPLLATCAVAFWWDEFDASLHYVVAVPVLLVTADRILVHYVFVKASALGPPETSRRDRNSCRRRFLPTGCLSPGVCRDYTLWFIATATLVYSPLALADSSNVTMALWCAIGALVVLPFAWHIAGVVSRRSSPSELLELPRAIFDALACFLTYNPLETETPAWSVHSPAGHCSSRNLLAIGTVLMGVSACGLLAEIGNSASVILPQFVRDGFETAGIEMPRLPHEPWTTSSGYLQVIATLATPVGFLLAALTCQIGIACARTHRSYRSPRSLLAVRGDLWRNAWRNMHHSSIKAERESLLLGFTTQSGLPVVLDLRLTAVMFLLGPPGFGKTGFLMNLVEQLGAMPDLDPVIVVLDFKADDMLLGATLEAVAKESGLDRYIFSNEQRASHLFNPMLSEGIQRLPTLAFVDMLTHAVSLQHGRSYGAAFYGDANQYATYERLRGEELPQSFRALRERLSVKRPPGADPELNRHGTHLKAIMNRLALLEQMNAVPGDGHPQEVFDHAIDFSRICDRRRSQQGAVIHFALRMLSEPTAAGERGRLALYTLMNCVGAIPHEHRRPVYFICDEAARFAEANVLPAIEQCRSLGISILFGLQSVEQLRLRDADLAAFVEDNFGVTLTFGGGNSALKNIVDHDTEVISLLKQTSCTTTRHWLTPATVSRGVSFVQRIRKRLDVETLRLAFAREHLWVLEAPRSLGYSQYSNHALIVATPRHLTEAEFQRRASQPWPEPGELAGLLCDTSQALRSRERDNFSSRTDKKPTPLVPRKSNATRRTPAKKRRSNKGKAP